MARPSTAPVGTTSSISTRPRTADASTSEHDDTEDEDPAPERKKAKTNPFGIKIVDCFSPTYKKGETLRGVCMFCKKGTRSRAMMSFTSSDRLPLTSRSNRFIPIDLGQTAFSAHLRKSCPIPSKSLPVAQRSPQFSFVLWLRDKDASAKQPAQGNAGNMVVSREVMLQTWVDAFVACGISFNSASHRIFQQAFATTKVPTASGCLMNELIVTNAHFLSNFTRSLTSCQTLTRLPSFCPAPQCAAWPLTPSIQFENSSSSKSSGPQRRV